MNVPPRGLAFTRDILLQKCNKMYLGQAHHIKSCGMNMWLCLCKLEIRYKEKGKLGQFRPNNDRKQHILFLLISSLRMSYHTLYK